MLAGAVLQGFGIGLFPVLVVGLFGGLWLATLRVPSVRDDLSGLADALSIAAVLRGPGAGRAGACPTAARGHLCRPPRGLHRLDQPLVPRRSAGPRPGAVHGAGLRLSGVLGGIGGGWLSSNLGFAAVFWAAAAAAALGWVCAGASHGRAA